MKFIRLLLFILLFLGGNVEVSNFIGALGGGDDAQIVSQILLLEELLGQVLDVSLRKHNIGRNSD